MKSYEIARIDGKVTCICFTDDGDVYDIRHSPINAPEFNYGVADNGADDLALAILFDWFEERPRSYAGSLVHSAWHAHKDFVWRFLMKKKEKRDHFTITGDEIRDFLQSKRAAS